MPSEPSSDTPQVMKRSPWPQSPAEFACDISMWLGILAIAWLAAAGFGLLPIGPWAQLAPLERLQQQKLFTAVLAFTALCEYFSLLVIMGRPHAAEDPQTALRKDLFIRFALTSTPWLFLLVAALVIRFDG
jgi:hypothetical protein